ncbi:Chromodomain-helicase-DNA-binding protein 2 [Astathelohania contejeani]|uniref:Chromodomain-helicase-DNA-binding protein 2 n=1 Tax=Astathelohania contejeani TaxID=164912 RepID=A0ABQ7I0V8_9MICR|nr:Chromodomain-helicase-DNA-binding protein 2 [Thelohania contejeani]
MQYRNQKTNKRRKRVEDSLDSNESYDNDGYMSSNVNDDESYQNSNESYQSSSESYQSSNDESYQSSNESSENIIIQRKKRRRRDSTSVSETEEETKVADDTFYLFLPVKEKIIDFVVDMEGSELTQARFLVKWVGQSHWHNEWIDYSENISGFKKMQNYYLKKMNGCLDTSSIIKASKEACTIDRIIHIRNAEHLIKWNGLPYSECTYETLNGNFIELINEYKSREAGLFIPHKGRARLVSYKKITSQPSFIKHPLRDYQIEGLAFMAYSFYKNNNVILADEMGLGKTIQAISLLNYLFNAGGVYGPFLVIIPLSTLPSWLHEFKKWAPKLNTIQYYGNAQARRIIREYEFYIGNKLKFNCLVTTYEIAVKDASILENINWATMIIDEAHRLKNDSALIYRTLQSFRSRHILLITGTPLQNSLKELWCILSFLKAGFGSLENFEAEFGELKEETQLQRLHEKLKPYIIRRLKKDVETLPAKCERILRIDLTPRQKSVYKAILTRNYAELTRNSGSNTKPLINLVSELKKCSSHSLLISDKNYQELLINGSGKMLLLDKLLERLKSENRKILIFSQMVMMLNILEDFLNEKGYSYERLDGNVPNEERKRSIERFNMGETFVFLLSTKAGGLGINLTTADTVIIYDSDWNPQNDLQAIGRAHRIGQKNLVNIYRLVSRDTVEEEILERAKKKMVLEHLVIQKMDETKDLKKEELDSIIKFGAARLFMEDNKEKDDKINLDEINLDEILKRSEIDGSGVEDMYKVTNFSSLSWKDIIPEEEVMAEEGVIVEDDFIDRVEKHETNERLKKERSIIRLLSKYGNNPDVFIKEDIKQEDANVIVDQLRQCEGIAVGGRYVESKGILRVVDIMDTLIGYLKGGDNIPFKETKWNNWGVDKDIKLMEGVIKYGVGAWSDIKGDAELGLGFICGDTIPQGPHLKRRLEYLVKSIREYNTKKTHENEKKDEEKKKISIDPPIFKKIPISKGKQGTLIGFKPLKKIFAPVRNCFSDLEKCMLKDPNVIKKSLIQIGDHLNEIEGYEKDQLWKFVAEAWPTKAEFGDIRTLYNKLKGISNKEG